MAKKRELQGVQKELEATRRQIDEYRRLEQALGQDLRRLETTNAEARRQMTEIRRRLRDAESRKAELRGRVGALAQATGFWRSSLQTDLRALTAARASSNPAYGTRELWAASLRRAAIEEKAAMLGHLKGFSRTTQQAAEESRRRAEELTNRKSQAEQQQLTREREYQAKMAAIAEAQQRKAQAIARAKELEESARALTRLIRSLGRGAAQYKKTGAVAQLDVPRHSLIWPVAGEVIKGFGRQRNAELDTWTINQGVLLATLAGTPVLALERGRVIYAGAFRSYGQVLIVDHGSNFFSIYGDLGEILTAKGAEVQAGETIARAGGEPGKPGSVYLEIRRGTEALDPLVWLRAR